LAGIQGSEVISRPRARLFGLFVTSDTVAIVAAFIWTYLFRFYSYIIPVTKGVPSIRSYLLILPLFLIVHLAIFYLQGFYRSRLKRTKLDDFLYIILNVLVTFAVVVAFLGVVKMYSGGRPLVLFGQAVVEPSRLYLATYGLGVVFMIAFLRNQIYFLMKRRYARGLNLQNVVVVGAGEMGVAVAQKLYQYADLGFVVKGFLDDERAPGDSIPINGGVPLLGRIADLGRVIEEQSIQEVYVALDLTNYARIIETVQIVNRYPVTIRLIPDLFQLLTLKANIQDLDGFPVISIDEVPLRGGKRILKRAFDIAVSGVGLLFLAPFFGVFAALIKLTSRGPIFYHQERVGMDGRRFVIHKFRTMVTDAEKATGAVMCQPDDPRITRLGRLMRRFSIDELPQLANVFTGAMSLVGPRPERPEFVKEFTEKIPKYMLRHKMKSGITGWAQVHGLRQGTSIEKRLEHDFYYIQNWSFTLDLKILWLTFRKGFIDRSITLGEK
jgi:Undecaprenyl-phosphate glucose phosphotransferase